MDGGNLGWQVRTKKFGFIGDIFNLNPKYPYRKLYTVKIYRNLDSNSRNYEFTNKKQSEIKNKNNLLIFKMILHIIMKDK